MAFVMPDNRKHYVEPTEEDPEGFYWEDQAWMAQAQQAERLLNETNFVVVNAMESGWTLTPEWRAWRESLKQVVRGVLDAVADPVEPQRYVEG